jgi:hypothetical protein
MISSRCLAAFWEFDLAADFCWGVNSRDRSRRPRPSLCRAPLWSWTSVDETVSWSSPNANRDKFDIEILETRCSSSSMDLAGTVSAGHLRLLVCLVSVTYGYAFNGSDKAPFCERAGVIEYFNADAPFTLPRADYVQVGCFLYCLQLGRSTDPSPPGEGRAQPAEDSITRHQALVLRPSKLLPNALDHIGIIQSRNLTAHQWFDVSPSEITIV